MCMTSAVLNNWKPQLPANPPSIFPNHPIGVPAYVTTIPKYTTKDEFDALKKEVE